MDKINYPALFANFEGREEGLRHVTRYHIYYPMYYRSNLFTHSKHVLWLLQSILPLAEEVFGTNLDSTKAQLMAVVHDDPEIVMGDISAGHKHKMTPEQLAEVEQQELAAIDTMARHYPYSILGYQYGDLMREGQQLQTLEAKLLKYADSFDAFGEALHEVYAGNQAFNTHSVHEELGVIDLPVEFCQKYLPSFPQKNSEFEELFSKPHPLFSVPELIGMQTVVSNGQLHSLESLRQTNGYAPYDTWKKIVLENEDEEEIQNLYTQKEFLAIT